MEICPVPKESEVEMEEKRKLLLEKLANIDDYLGEKFLNEEEPTVEEIHDAIRRQCIANKFIPVFVGSAKKNMGVQTLLDGVIRYLPCPYDLDSYGYEGGLKDKKSLVICSTEKPFVGLAFKLEDGQFGQLTYMRIYQGVLKKGDPIVNVNAQKKLKVPRLVRMHSNEMEDIKNIGPGEICAMFGLECSSGDTFVSPGINITMESMHIPKPVISMSIALKDKSKDSIFAKCLNRFQREDPTFQITYDMESGQTLMHGMGELHLQIHLERMLREYDCEVISGKPYVNYREAISKKVTFDYLHKKQTGGAGQYARVIGYIEQLPDDSEQKFEFLNHVVGNSIPPNFITACANGFKDVSQKGPQLDCPVWGVRVVLTDGVTHPVDSSELAFRTACFHAFRNAVKAANPIIIEPIMKVEIQLPQEYQAQVVSGINRRRGTIVGTDDAGGLMIIYCEVPLGEMFGYSTELRSMTQGKGEFSMDYKEHTQAPSDVQAKLVLEYQKTKAQ